MNTLFASLGRAGIAGLADVLERLPEYVISINRCRYVQKGFSILYAHIHDHKDLRSVLEVFLVLIGLERLDRLIGHIESKITEDVNTDNPFLEDGLIPWEALIQLHDKSIPQFDVSPFSSVALKNGAQPNEILCIRG